MGEKGAGRRDRRSGLSGCGRSGHSPSSRRVVPRRSSARAAPAASSSPSLQDPWARRCARFPLELCSPRARSAFFARLAQNRVSCRAGVTLRSSPRFRGLRAITRASPQDGLANQLVFPVDAVGGRAHDVRDVLPRDVLLLLLAAQNHHQKVAATQTAAAPMRPSVPAVDPRFAVRRASELARRHPRRSLRVVRSAKASPRIPRARAIAATEPRGAIRGSRANFGKDERPKTDETSKVRLEIHTDRARVAWTPPPEPASSETRSPQSPGQSPGGSSRPSRA